MVLVLACLFAVGALYLTAEAVTYPARLRQRSVQRAASYGSVRIPRTEQELLRFRDRVLVPARERLASIPIKLHPRTSLDTIATRIVAAGLSHRLTVSTYLACKGGAALVGACAGLLLVAVSPVLGLLAMPLLGMVGLIAPEWILSAKIRSRRERIRGDLPDALDLLAVSVEAGLGFDAAVTKLTEHMNGPLIDEFALMLSEIRVGEARSVALKKMAGRVDAPELSNFVRAVVQAEQLGISLGRILRIQAADTRLRRQAAAEEKAMKAPIKMLFPTVFLIFPTLFIVVLGPAFLNILKIFR